MPHDVQDTDLEVQFKPESGKAVIAGKTVVPFQAFVTLVLQRKVVPLFKTWGKTPVIIDSELLTSLASAGQDSQENRSNIILVSLVAGALVGIVGLAVIEMALMTVDIALGYNELGIIVGSIALLVVLLYLMMKVQRKPKGDKMVETIESLSSFLSSRK